MFVPKQLLPPETISRDCQVLQQQQPPQPPPMNDLKIILNSIKLSTSWTQLADNPFCRLTVRPSLLKTLTDGTRISTAAAAACARRMMTRINVGTCHFEPALSVFPPSSFYPCLRAVNLMALFHRSVCEWMPSYSIAGEFRPYIMVHRRRSIRHPPYVMEHRHLGRASC